MHHRLALMGVTLVASVPLGVAAAPASAASYPSSVRSQYQKSCQKAAKGQGVSSRDARTYCRASLRCIQRELTLRQFKRFGVAVARGDKTPPYLKDVKGCVREAARRI